MTDNHSRTMSPTQQKHFPWKSGGNSHKENKLHTNSFRFEPRCFLLWGAGQTTCPPVSYETSLILHFYLWVFGCLRKKLMVFHNLLIQSRCFEVCNMWKPINSFQNDMFCTSKCMNLNELNPLGFTHLCVKSWWRLHQCKQTKLWLTKFYATGAY